MHTPQADRVAISIHALREEGDCKMSSVRIDCKRFQSTPSARRATPAFADDVPYIDLFQSTPSARRATAISSQIVR